MIDRIAARDRDGWTVSSFSGSEGACVEVKFDRGTVLVGDSKDRRAGRPIMLMPSVGWAAFVNTLTDQGST